VDSHQAKVRFSLHFAAAMLVLAGCAPQLPQPRRVCPGKQSVGESLDLLKSRSEHMVPLKAHGQCRLHYYAEGKKHKENFPVKIWVDPPAEIYLQGDVAFDPKGIVFGSNENEFWLAMKPKEIRGYWWGNWSDANCPEKLMISPKLVLETLTVAAVGGEGSWSLSKQGPFDVLIKKDRGTETRKIYISNCDYLVRRIEYFDADGRTILVAEMDKHKEVCEGFFVPTFVRIVKQPGQIDEGWVDITLSLRYLKSATFSEKLRDRLFIRPVPRGFEHVYKIVSGDIIEQPQ
jgi:hypothetical protein